MNIRETDVSDEPGEDLSEIEYRFNQARYQIGRLENLIQKLEKRLVSVINPSIKPGVGSETDDRKAFSPLAEDLHALECRVASMVARVDELLSDLAL